MNPKSTSNFLFPFLLTSLSTTVVADEIFDEVKISHTTSSVINLSNDDDFGTAVAGIGDLNGDGNDDVVVGIPDDDTLAINGGAVRVCFLNQFGGAISSVQISGGTILGRLGQSVASIGDIDGDGNGDIAVGKADGVWIFFLTPLGGFHSSQQIADGIGGFSGGVSNGFGHSVAGIPDINGNGVPDLVVGAPFDDDGGTNAGAIYVIRLNSNGTVQASRKISETTGGFVGSLDSFDNFGDSVCYMGNLDGDAHDEIAVGAHADDDGANVAGAVYILDINNTGIVTSTQKISNLSGGMSGLVLGDSFGQSVANMGDVDGDGINDMVVGAIGDDDGGVGIGNNGAVHTLLMNANGTVKSHSKFSAATHPLDALIQDGDLFGRSVGTVGDRDGDGIDELVVGSPGDDDGGNARGAIYVLFHKGFQPALVEPYGCDLNGPGTLATTGVPALGETMTFHIDNPFATQFPGSIPLLVVSLNGLASPCGAIVPGMSMIPGNPTAEVLVSLPAVVTVVGPAWLGALVPVDVPLSIPDDTALLGLELYAQGVLHDFFPSGSSVETALTTGRKLTIGACP